MKVQVLYNLRDCIAWISGNDLHQLFYQLVGDMSPSGGKDFDPTKLKSLDKEAYDWLSKKEFSLMLATEHEWKVHEMNLTIEEATTMEWKIWNNGVFPKEKCSLQIVPNEAVAIMQGLEPSSVGFGGGMVCLSSPQRYNNHVIVLGIKDPLDFRHTTKGYWEQFMRTEGNIK